MPAGEGEKPLRGVSAPIQVFVFEGWYCVKLDEEDVLIVGKLKAVGWG